MATTRATQSTRIAKAAKPAPTTTPAPARPAPKSGSPAQLLQLQRRYGNQAVQQSIQRQAAGAQAIQRAGVNEQDSFSQPNDVLGMTTTPQTTNVTPAAELERQVNQLISHAVLASADFKELITEVVDYVNFQIPGGCTNGDPTFQHVTKELQSATDKAKGRMKGETVADMKDVLRGTIKCRSVQALTLAQEYLDDRAGRIMAFTQIGVGGTQRKDGFQPDKRKSPGDMVGYGDIKYLTPVIHWAFDQPLTQSNQSPGFWMYSEIQLMTDAMNKKKMEGGGHTFYDLTREAKEGVSDSGAPIYRIPKTDNTKHAVEDLLANHDADLRRGLNLAQYATLLPKLHDLVAGQNIVLTKAEYEGLELAGELVYRRERVEGNVGRQGIGA